MCSERLTRVALLRLVSFLIHAEIVTKLTQAQHDKVALIAAAQTQVNVRLRFWRWY